MKKFFKVAGIIVCMLVLISYTCCILTAYLPPSSLPSISVMALAFPYVLLLMIATCGILFFVNRKPAFIFLIIICLGYKNIFSTFGLHAGTKWQNKKDESSLRILTWNVMSFFSIHPNVRESSGWKLYTEKIKEWNPDVICFQEYKNVELLIKFNNIRSQLDSLGYKYFYCSDDFISKSKSWKAFHGCAIYSKFPIASCSKVKIFDGGPDQNESIVSTDISFKDKWVRIFTGHLASFRFQYESSYIDKSLYSETFERRRFILHKIKERELIHEEQVKNVRMKIEESPYPVIYCGDINSTPSSYTYHLLKQNLQDAFIESGFGLGKTFSRFGPTLRIDMCFVDNQFKVVQNEIPRVILSDHFPVLTDIQWKE